MFDKVHNPLRLPRETTSERPKVVWTPGVFNILASKCASRHNGVHFFDISTLFLFFLHFFWHFFAFPRLGVIFCAFFCNSHGNLFYHFFWAFPRPGLSPSPPACSGWENDKKMTKKWPACWWNCVFGLSSSALDPAALDEKTTNRWRHKNCNKMAEKMPKKWQPNCEKITKNDTAKQEWQKSDKTKWRKMTKTWQK